MNDTPTPSLGTRSTAAAPAAGPSPWLQSVLAAMLTVTAVVVPVLAALALFISPSPRYPIDFIVLGAAGVLLPVLRLARAPSLRVRAFAGNCTLFVAGIYALTRAGFAAGVSVVLVSTSVIGVICFGRRLGFLLIATAGLAHVVVGVLVTRGVLHLDPAEVDPFQLQNWVRMASIIVLLATLLAVVIDFVIRHVEANAAAATRALAELRIAYERLGRLHEQLESAKEEERRFIAHELHDELGQTLTALKLRLQLDARLSAIPPPEGRAPEALALIDQLIGRVRKMSVDLRPPLLDEVGLVPALRAYLDNQVAVSGVAIDLVSERPEGGRLAPDLEIACFRVVQESITNALKHAAAGRIQVRITGDATRLALSVRDDGRGFDTATLDSAVASGHLGVLGMRARVRARSGVFHLTSRPGAGTSVEIQLPMG